jgi:hypothetical protein
MPLTPVQMQQLQVGSRPPLGAMGGRGRAHGGTGAWGGGRGGYGGRGGRGDGGGRGAVDGAGVRGAGDGVAAAATANTSATLPPPPLDDGEERHCASCDRSFKGQVAMTAHRNMHVTCGEDGCQFQASGKALKVCLSAPHPSQPSLSLPA